jgi:hypothetical protein
MGGFQHWRVVAVGVLLGAAPVAWGCKCVPEPVSVCQAYERNTVVFLGKVESMEPDVRGVRWKIAGVNSADELEQLLKDGSPAALNKVKQVYAASFPAIGPRVLSAKSMDEVSSLFQELIQDGIRLRFRVDLMFKGPETNTVDVWTDVSSCGLLLDKGETAVIYAGKDESGRLTTALCRGPRGGRREEALEYLLLRKLDPESAGYVEGWLTTDAGDSKPHPPRPVGSPVVGADLMLESSRGATWRGSTDEEGRFVFMRLPAGEYTLRPADERSAFKPVRMQLKSDSCRSELIQSILTK